MRSAVQPLTGVRVIDVTQIMAGPFCTMLLGDMGADVIKIEKPDGGDDVRRSGPPFVAGESATFLNIGRNKRSVVIDMKRPEGAEIVRGMARDAEIFVQNLRPGRLEGFGLGYENIRAVNPAIVYATITGFGRTGPYKDKPGFDLMAQGLSGIMSVTGHPGQPPVKVSVPITDLNAGLFTAYGILAAYVNRLKTGVGQHVDSSLMEAGVAYTMWESAIYFTTGRSPGPNGSAHQISAPYQALPVSDGYITVGGANQRNWQRFCRAIDRTDLISDPRFENNAGRMANRPALEEELGKTLTTQPAAHWLSILEGAGVPCGPINDISQVYADPQVIARDMVVEVEHPTAGAIRNVGIPVKFSETPGSIRRPPPRFAEHTEEVLGEFGYTTDEIDSLRSQGIVKTLQDV
ncbi:MAG: CoA transferase [Dehalococcoidia bacterium]|nr:CoA transferase [Dehalococcoidia bacterium]